MTKGSEWRKWNFHVHTKGTNKNDQFTSSTIDDFFHIFYKRAFDKQVSAVGITDYFSVENYHKAIEYKSNLESKIDPEGNALFEEEEIEFINDIFIFPNVELRMLPSTDRGRLVNIHCLFNPDYVSELENDFFSHIENQDGQKMNKHGITSYGKSLDLSIQEEQEQYKKGIENFVISLDSLKRLVSTNKNFRDNTLLAVSNSSNDGASALQEHYDLFENDNGSLDGLRRSIYRISDAIFSANPKDVKYFIGKRSEGTEGYNEDIYIKEIEEVKEHRGSLKPCIVGCDAHKEDDLFSRFTWVKGDSNFEGLRQICFEPEQRVRIQDSKPDFKEEKLLIDKVRFISPSNIFSTQSIYLNPNLNVIIGGKSSGKSILLYSIARTLTADTTVLQNDDGSYRYDLRKVEKDFNFEIMTKGGFAQHLYRDEEENSILPEIKYIPQNYLVKLAEPELNKKGKSLNKLVRDLITEDNTFNEVYQDFINKVIRNDKLRNAQIDLFFETLREIEDLEAQLKSKSNQSVLEGNIKNNTEKVEELNKNAGLSQEKVEKYKILQNELEKNSAKGQKLKNDFLATKSFNDEFVRTSVSLKQRKEALLSSMQLSEVREYYQRVYSLIDELVEKSQEIETSLSKEANSDSKFQEVSSSISGKKDKLDDSIRPFLQNAQIREVIEKLNESISNDRKALMDIERLTEKVHEKKELLDRSKAEIFNIYQNSYSEYIKVIDNLKERTVELEKDGLNIVGRAQFNFPKLRKTLEKVSDGRTASYNQYDILSEKKKATDEAHYQSIFEEVKRLFEDIISKKYALISKTSIPNAIKFILDDYFFDYWEITYKNDKLGEMSTGKASFVILMLIIGLSKSKAPILIDQPEDNLDNRSITTDLVNYLRNKKLERQIIVVTHNANIVVNADAENVIVANQKGQNDDQSTSEFKFDYINGSIESSFDKKPNETDILKSMGIRQHIADIVEGGKDAFMMREKKYRFR